MSQTGSRSKATIVTVTAATAASSPGWNCSGTAVTVTIVAFDLDPVWLILGAIAVGLAWSIAF